MEERVNKKAFLVGNFSFLPMFSGGFWLEKEKKIHNNYIAACKCNYCN